jgi:hypothetical protein
MEVLPLPLAWLGNPFAKCDHCTAVVCESSAGAPASNAASTPLKGLLPFPSSLPAEHVVTAFACLRLTAEE